MTLKTHCLPEILETPLHMNGPVLKFWETLNPLSKPTVLKTVSTAKTISKSPIFPDFFPILKSDFQWNCLENFWTPPKWVKKAERSTKLGVFLEITFWLEFSGENRKLIRGNPRDTRNTENTTPQEVRCFWEIIFSKKPWMVQKKCFGQSVYRVFGTFLNGSGSKRYASIKDTHHCDVFWRLSSWLVVSNVKSVNTPLSTNRLLGPWCNVKWCISWIWANFTLFYRNYSYWKASKLQKWHETAINYQLSTINFQL